jgi:hypothetical protein
LEESTGEKSFPLWEEHLMSLNKKKDYVFRSWIDAKGLVRLINTLEW